MMFNMTPDHKPTKLTPKERQKLRKSKERVQKVKRLQRSRKRLIRELDAVVREIVIKRDGKCIDCGTTEHLTPGHVFSRRSYSTRWDLENVWGQCAGCNLKHEHHAWTMYNNVIKKIGQERFDRLERLFRTPIKLSTADLENMLKIYQEMKG